MPITSIAIKGFKMELVWGFPFISEFDQYSQEIYKTPELQWPLP